MPETTATVPTVERIHEELRTEILRYASDRLRYEAYAQAGMGDDARELYDAVSVSEETLRSFGQGFGWEIPSREAARDEARQRLLAQARRELKEAEDVLAGMAEARGTNTRTHKEQQTVEELAITADRARAVLIYLGAASSEEEARTEK